MVTSNVLHFTADGDMLASSLAMMGTAGSFQLLVAFTTTFIGITSHLLCPYQEISMPSAMLDSGMENTLPSRYLPERR